MNILRIAIVFANVVPHLTEEVCLYLMMPNNDTGQLHVNFEWVKTWVYRVVDGPHAGFSHDAKIIADILEFGMEKRGDDSWTVGHERLINRTLKLTAPNGRTSFTLYPHSQHDNEPRIITFSFVHIANLM